MAQQSQEIGMNSKMNVTVTVTEFYVLVLNFIQKKKFTVRFDLRRRSEFEKKAHIR
jgi:hypothetical protein